MFMSGLRNWYRGGPFGQGLNRQYGLQTGSLSNVPQRHISDPTVNARPDLAGANSMPPKQFDLTPESSLKPVTPVTNRPNYAAALRSYNAAPRGSIQGVQRDG